MWFYFVDEKIEFFFFVKLFLVLVFFLEFWGKLFGGGWMCVVESISFN